VGSFTLKPKQGDHPMTTTKTNLNGQERKTLASQIDRLDSILDGAVLQIYCLEPYFIPHELRRRDGLSLEEDVREQGLPADVLGDYLAAVPALKRILILDTCASGGAVGLTRAGRNPFAFRGVIEKLGRSQGVFTLAAAAATEEAQEVKELGHGVLSYTLLAGLGAVQQGPLKEQVIRPDNPERVASVLEWFNFASGQVPRLSKRYLGREQDVQMSSQGQSFPVLPVEDP
jgi:hypothetical protein